MGLIGRSVSMSCVSVVPLEMLETRCGVLHANEPVLVLAWDCVDSSLSDGML
jgi:hypothetical protein